jgi:ATP-dependent Clp protease protease subunit
MGAGYVVKAKANQSAEILIYEDVGEGWFGGVSAKRFADDLRALGDVKTLDVRINSYGGDVFDGIAIYQQLVKHKAKVTTHIDGVAASIASVIAMAGTEIHIAEAGWLMIHDAWGMSVGNATEMRRQADLLDSVTGQIAGVYEARTKQPMPKLRSWMSEEKWFSASEALEVGFATNMAENLRMAAHLANGPQRVKFHHLPAALEAGSAPAGSDVRTLVAKQAQQMKDRQALKVHRSRGAG